MNGRARRATLLAMQIREFAAADTGAVVELWRRCDLIRPWNDPNRDIARKLVVADDPSSTNDSATRWTRP